MKLRFDWYITITMPFPLSGFRNYGRGRTYTFGVYIGHKVCLRVRLSSLPKKDVIIFAGER